MIDEKILIAFLEVLNGIRDELESIRCVLSDINERD